MHVAPPADAAATAGTAAGAALPVLALLTPPCLGKRGHLGTAVRGRDANVWNLLPPRNGLCQSNGRRTPDADDTVPATYPRNGIIDDALGDVDEGGVEDPRVEIRDEGLDAAGEGDAAGAADDEGCREV